MHLNKQIDFVKYRPAGSTGPGHGNPGGLYWDQGVESYIEVDADGGSTGFRFLGNKAELNDYPAAWQAYPEKYTKLDNLGKPNGGINTEWITRLREQSLTGTNTIVQQEEQ